MWNILRFVVVNVVAKEADMTSNFYGMSQLMCSFLKIVVVSSRPNPRMRELPKRERCCWELLLVGGPVGGSKLYEGENVKVSKSIRITEARAIGLGTLCQQQYYI